MTRFFIIGGQRCGSSYLRNLLSTSPDVSMARPETERHVDPYATRQGTIEPKFFVTDQWQQGIEEFDRRYFPDGGDVLGAKTAGMLEEPLAAERLKATFPDAKVIAIVRDPVERAWSNYRYSVDSKVEYLRPELALDEMSETREWDRRITLSPFLYLRRGRYAQLLEPWWSFDLLVITLDELIGGPEGVEHVSAFLGVTPPTWDPAPVNISTPYDMPPEVRATLRSYYRAPNHRLEDLLPANQAEIVASWGRSGLRTRLPESSDNPAPNQEGEARASDEDDQRL